MSNFYHFKTVYSEFGVLNVDDKSETNIKSLETAFEKGILDFKYYLENNREESFPDYTIRRFISEPDERLVNCRELAEKVNKNILKAGIEMVNEYISMAYNVPSENFKREEGSKNGYFSSTLNECSPWQIKSTHSGLTSRTKDVCSETIFSSLEIFHKNGSKNRLMVQQSASHFGYMPHMFFARCNVLFPPVAAGEIWTVGFIQYSETDSMVNLTHFDGNRKFALFY